jgi:hypothetical protein
METKDYLKFKFLKTNRIISETNVRKIKDSIREFGIIPGRPILVDENHNIIDGQHRFIAIKELGLTVTYEIIEGDTIAKTMALNSNQSQWQLIDFVRSYAEQGNDNYRKLLKFEEKYKIGFVPSLYLFFGVKYKGSEIKKGKHFEIQENAEEIAEYLKSLDSIPFRYQKSFVIAVINLFKKTKESHREIIRLNILKIPHFFNTRDYTSAFENILNQKKKNNFTRL